MDFLRRLYNSEFSKKIGIYKNQEFLRLYRYISDRVSPLYASLCSKKLRTLYSNKELTTENISKLTYQDLDYLISYDIDLFKKISTEIYSVNLERIKTKGKISVGFFINNLSSWSCDRIYRLFEENPLYEPVILVVGLHDGTLASRRDTYKETVDYFEKSDYRIIGLWDGVCDEPVTWDNVPCPDIVFLLTPYSGSLPKELNIYQIPLSTLLVYIPYAILSDKLDWWFDSPGPQLSWTYFCENSFFYDMIGSTAELGNSNVVVSGHPKLDPLINPLVELDPMNIWKFSPNANPSCVRKIVYTPHQSIDNGEHSSSTFHQNYMYFYNYAREHPDTTSWIIKPHPLLRSRSVEYGLFNSESEYDAYLDLWDALPNAKTVRTGHYQDLFITSDAMITDSGSFLTEYLSVNKPIILLTRNQRLFNSWGMFVFELTYPILGTDYPGITQMIENVILCDDDPLSGSRESMYEKYFKRSPEMFVDASTYIYNYIQSFIRER